MVRENTDVNNRTTFVQQMENINERGMDVRILW